MGEKCCDYFEKSPIIYLVEKDGLEKEICVACLREFINDGWHIKDIRLTGK